MTSEGKEELEKAAALKAKNAIAEKENTTLFMDELHEGLDENEE